MDRAAHRALELDLAFVGILQRPPADGVRNPGAALDPVLVLRLALDQKPSPSGRSSALLRTSGEPSPALPRRVRAGARLAALSRLARGARPRTPQRASPRPRAARRALTHALLRRPLRLRGHP